MDKVIASTNNLITIIENSPLIEKLEHYKSNVINNDALLNKIKRYRNCEDKYEAMALKKEIYENSDYSFYMKYYSELFYYVLKINKKFKELTDVRGCH